MVSSSGYLTKRGVRLIGVRGMGKLTTFGNPDG